MNAVTEPIDYKNDEIAKVFKPKVDEKIPESLSYSVTTKNIMKLAATELFQAEFNTHDSLNILEFFQQPAFIPARFRLKPSLVRKDIFTECTDEYQQLVDQFKKLNEEYTIPTKAIIYKDKLLVHRQAQNESRNVLFRSILSITKAAAACSVPNRVPHTLMSLNHTILGPVKATNNDDGERAPIAGFAYLLLITDQIPEIRQHTGIDTDGKVFEQATNYLLTPKAVQTKEKPHQDNSVYVRIGNLTFTAPGEDIWNASTSIASKTSKIIAHITSE